MAYDAYMNRATGDWVIDGHGDFKGATGIEFDRQRIWIRAKVPKNTFTYDPQLGSTLHEIPRNPPRNQLEVARTALYTALEGISGVSIDDIDVVQVDRQIGLLVHFTNTPLDEGPGTFLFELATAPPEGTEFGIEGR